MKWEKMTGQSIADAFEEFDQDNPKIYELFKQQAFKAIQKGRSRISGKQIIEWIRWEKFIQTENRHGFKINNVFTAHYVRKFVAEFPQHESRFELRRLRA